MTSLYGLILDPAFVSFVSTGGVLCIPRTSQLRPAFPSISKPSNWTVTLVSAKSVCTSRLQMAGMCPVFAFIPWPVAHLSVSVVSVSRVALALKAIVEIETNGIWMAIVCPAGTFIHGSDALVSVSHISLVAPTAISGELVRAGCVGGALVTSLSALVNIRHARDPVSVKSGIAFAGIAVLSVAISFRNAMCILAAIVFARLAIRPFVATRLSQFY